jgi:hypothetical protein
MQTSPGAFHPLILTRDCGRRVAPTGRSQSGDWLISPMNEDVSLVSVCTLIRYFSLENILRTGPLDPFVIFFRSDLSCRETGVAMQITNRGLVFGWGWGVVCLTGCGGATAPKLPDPVPVTGTVIIDSKPLADAIVTFVPDKGATATGLGANAVTDASGNFEVVTTFGKKARPGAIPGKYRVAISRLIGPTGSPVKLEPGVPPANAAARESLPPRYSDMMMTELKADVGAEGGTFDFKVKLK